VSLEIEVNARDGTSDHAVRVVTENERTLNFTNQDFEME